jgi:hypothetical protein
MRRVELAASESTSGGPFEIRVKKPRLYDGRAGWVNEWRLPGRLPE